MDSYVDGIKIRGQKGLSFCQYFSRNAHLQEIDVMLNLSNSAAKTPTV